MIKSIIFDCFGVVYEDAFDRVYRSFGGNPVSDRPFIAQVFHDSNSGKIPASGPKIAEHLGISFEQWKQASVGVGNIDYAVLSYTTELRKNYKVAMLSNVSSAGLEAHMDVSVLQKYFDPIIESAKIGFAKPEARAYEIAAEMIGVRLDECVLIDDRENYCEGAAHVGMKTIVYTDLQSLKSELAALLATEA